MIEVYYWPTPNGHKITIFLEEAGIDYKIVPVNILQGEQFDPRFLALSPNNKIPAIIDHCSSNQKPLTLFESGAILLYLADKYRQFIAVDAPSRYHTLQWLFWQVAGLGPMAGQTHHFTQYADVEVPYAIERYVRETRRLYGVLDKQLAQCEYISGDYSIADMACYPWIVMHEKQQQNLDHFPHIKRWYQTLTDRPAIQRAYALRDKLTIPEGMSAQAKRILFGSDPER